MILIRKDLTWIGALDFFEKPWFHPPQYYRTTIAKRKEKNRNENERRRLNNLKIKNKIFETSTESRVAIEEGARIVTERKVVKEEKNTNVRIKHKEVTTN